MSDPLCVRNLHDMADVEREMSLSFGRRGLRSARRPSSGRSASRSWSRTLAHRYPETRFVGYRHGEDLAAYLAAADVFVFPSRTDTFGLVLLEAMASGVPVAAYPVPGPSDVVIQHRTGVLHQDLQRATLEALKLGGEGCVAHARHYSWRRSAEAFATLIEPAGPSAMSGPVG